MLVMVACLGGILARLLLVQGVDAATYQADARSEYVHEVSFLGERGSILDRNGDELAMSVPMTTVYADPYQVSNPLDEAEALAPVLGTSVSALRGELSEASGFVYLARTVPDATAAKVEKLISGGNMAGIYTMQEPKRFDPAGQLAAPLIGVVGTDGQGLSGPRVQVQRLARRQTGQAPGGHGPRREARYRVGSRSTRPRSVVTTSSFLSTSLSSTTPRRLWPGPSWPPRRKAGWP